MQLGTRIQSCVESAWFQCYESKYVKLLSSFAFNTHLRSYIKAETVHLLIDQSRSLSHDIMQTVTRTTQYFATVEMPPLSAVQAARMLRTPPEARPWQRRAVVVRCRPDVVREPTQVITTRGLHSCTFQLNLKRLRSLNH